MVSLMVAVAVAVCMNELEDFLCALCAAANYYDSSWWSSNSIFRLVSLISGFSLRVALRSSLEKETRRMTRLELIYCRENIQTKKGIYI